MVNLDTRLRRGTALTKLADLLSIKGWEALCQDLKLQGEEADRNKVRKKPGILIPKISHAQLLDRVLNDRGPAISMLNEVMEFLEVHGNAARTTGTIATLPGLEDLKPQHRKIMGEWDRHALKRLGGNRKLEDMWKEASTTLDVLLEASSTCRPGSWRPSRYGDFYQQRPDEITYHEDVVELLRTQVELIRTSLPDTEDPFIGGMTEKCNALNMACDELTANHHAGYASLNDYAEEKDKITIFVEQMRITATLLANLDGIAALIELSVFRNLPQLFEVWLLCYILRTLEGAGYAITLENVGLVDRPDVWNLRYTGASTPVARIGSDAWVFFQYKAKIGSTMPDFAIYDNNTASGSAMIVLDAKFSEKSAYTATDYQATLTKYNNLSPHRFTVEYMDRADITSEKGMMFGVRPGMPALKDLKRVLFEALVTPARPALAVIDCSQSFADRLPRALATLKLWADAGLLKDEFVLFAGKSELHQRLARQIETHAIRLACDNGTSMTQLRRQLLGLREQAGNLDVLLVSDGEFEDGSLDGLRAVTNRLWTFDIP
ncbi:hypothetical protein KRZ98_12245 [Sphingobium sp. AS12]|uniref:hypothetical protein n=1 Tax=Sphingobium sp. AS12 TaxID=2849495 RepID=UPI001C31758F|nr:hypothetical protein [Sphingobium sp. AS12]MBV2149050.1 hypothetical protein [Sphingobium sp. AS12]